MQIRSRQSWEIPESQLTSQSVFQQRRAIIRGLGLTGLAGLTGATSLLGMSAQAAVQAQAPYTKDSLGVPVTPFDVSSRYNNFYEFGSHKGIYKRAQNLVTDNWNVAIRGAVDKEKTIGLEDILKAVEIQDRYYRFRCVEAWAMAVPWRGFPLKSLISMANPLSSAKYVYMETAEQEDAMPGLKQHWYPWPYREALTIEEANHDLAFMVTGIYGEDLPKQFGAPIRLVLPWKYGFKSIKSIVSLTFVEERPTTFWEEINSSEYGFWANVNPQIDHPRWSQATERDIESGDRRPTKLFNGYGDAVASLYPANADDTYFR